MSAHLAILTRARLVTARRESRSIFYAIDWAGLAALTAYLVEDCCQGRPELCAPLADVVERAAACCD
jgi:DNA-binding transcriptional ArsR family regulator